MKLTTGERLIWAAVFAAHYGLGDGDDEHVGSNVDLDAIEQDAAVCAADIATDAVLALRGALARKRFGDDEVTAIVTQLLEPD